jgi:SAM-dependent methyltransferase
MSEVVGEGGNVVAVDRKTTYLSQEASPPTQIIEGDLLDIELDPTFDLVHCRYVLIHNRRSDELLRKLCNVLKPGGFLVVEEPDFTSTKLLNHDADDAHRRLNHAVCRMFEQMHLDPAYGLSLPRRVAAEGLELVEVDARLHLARGGSLMARMMGASERALADKYVATGEASHADIEHCIDKTNDDQHWAVYYSTVSVVATKPPF